MAEYEHSKRPGLSLPLQSVSATTLSSLRRSDAPNFSPSDKLASLVVPLLHRVLSFVPSHDFFFSYPFVSCYHRWSYSSADLHRSYGRQRFGLRRPMWRNFSSEAWPQLHIPVWQYKHYKSQHAFDDTDRDEKRGGVQKDWSLECTHAYQHLHFARLYLMRHAPKRGSNGSSLSYTLPPIFDAVIIDRLTSRAVTDILTGERFYGMWERGAALLELDYSYFVVDDSCNLVSLPFSHTANRSERSSAAVPTVVQIRIVKAKQTKKESESAFNLKFLNEWVDVVEDAVQTAKNDGGDNESTRVMVMAQTLVEVSVVASVTDDHNYGGVQAVWCLWWGPALREAVAETLTPLDAASAGIAGTAPAHVVVDLSAAPLVWGAMSSYEAAIPPMPRLEHSSAQWWLTQEAGLSDVQTFKRLTYTSYASDMDPDKEAKQQQQQADDFQRLDDWTNYNARSAPEQMNDEKLEETKAEWRKLQRQVIEKAKLLRQREPG